MIGERFRLDDPLVEQHLYGVFDLLDFFGFGHAVAGHQGEQVVADRPHVGVDFFLFRTRQVADVLIHRHVGPADQQMVVVAGPAVDEPVQADRQ